MPDVMPASDAMAERFDARARARRIEELSRAPFDLLIIGGGITGAGIARDAAMRGMSVALVERTDFACGTSSRSSRLIHGGVRYLEHGEFHLVFESSRERRILLEIAPHLVRPLPFLWPVYEGARIPAWMLGAGLFLYDLLSLFRNVSRHRRLSAGMVAEREPALMRQGLTGGAVYFDAATDDARLTVLTARAAAASGATILNHVEARSLCDTDGAMRRVTLVDRIGGRELTASARIVVNAAGPWSDDVRRLAVPSAPSGLRGTKGVHIALPHDRVRNRGAVTLLSNVDGRVFFVLPAGDAFTIVGTTDSDYAGPLDSVRATPSDVDYLLRSANAFFPEAHLETSDVVSAWAGVRPLVADPHGDPSSVSREHALTWNAPAFLSVTGGKLTTYRSMAAEVVDEVLRALGRRSPPARTDRVPLPGGELETLAAEEECASRTIAAPETAASRALATHLVQSYGSEWRSVWRRAQSAPHLAAPLAPPLPYIGAELVHAVECEMALTLGDLLIRRLHPAFELRDNARSIAPAAATIVAPSLDWDAARVAEELEEYAEEVQRIFGWRER